MPANQDDRLRLATLRVLRQQLLEVKRTAAILEADYRPGFLAADNMHLLGDHMAGWDALVGLLIDAEPRMAVVDDDRSPGERYLEQFAEALDRIHEATS